MEIALRKRADRASLSATSVRIAATRYKKTVFSHRTRAAWVEEVDDDYQEDRCRNYLACKEDFEKPLSLDLAGIHIIGGDEYVSEEH